MSSVTGNVLSNPYTVIARESPTSKRSTSSSSAARPTPIGRRRRFSRRPCGTGSASAKDAWAGSDCSCFIVMGLIVWARSPAGIGHRRMALAASRASPQAHQLRANSHFSEWSRVVGVVSRSLRKAAWGRSWQASARKRGRGAHPLFGPQRRQRRARPRRRYEADGRGSALARRRRFLPVDPAARRGRGMARRLAPALTALAKKPVLCRLQRDQPADRRAGRRDRRADRRQVRRWRHHRRPAALRL